MLESTAQPFPPFHVIDNVYYVGSAGLSAWVIKTAAGLILLDVGMPENPNMVEKNIQTLGFRLRDVKILLNQSRWCHSHHSDYTGSLRRRHHLFDAGGTKW